MLACRHTILDDGAEPALNPLDPFSVSCVFEVWLCNTQAAVSAFPVGTMVQRRQCISDATTPSHHSWRPM